MYVLALETSGRVGSVALLDSTAGETRVVEECELPAGQRTARSLLPQIQQLLAKHSLKTTEVELVATTTGPGSFTGLRIGVVAAKTLSYAIGAKLVGVHTLAALAQNVGARDRPIWTILDAQREELFSARFEPTCDLAESPSPPTEILSIDDWLSRLQPRDAVAGPPLAKFRGRVPAGVDVIDEALWRPSAAAVGRLAIELAARGIATPPLELVPNYYRKSAAEEKAAH